MTTPATPATTPTYKAVALDLDGTLLQSNHQLSDESISTLRNLHGKGLTVIIATGRGASTVYEHIRRLELPVPMPLVCSNGGRGLSVPKDLTGTTPVFLSAVPSDVVKATVRFAETRGLVIQYYADDHIYANPTSDEQNELVKRSSAVTQSNTIFVKDDFAELLADTDGRQPKLPSKLIVMCYTVQDLKELESSYRAEIGGKDKIHLIPSKSSMVVDGKPYYCFLEILHPDANKGKGLKKMLDVLSIDLKDCVAFGDQGNDYEFIQMAGRGIVMKNGINELKAVADEVIDFTNDEHGVAKTLDRMDKEGMFDYSKGE